MDDPTALVLLDTQLNMFDPAQSVDRPQERLAILRDVLEQARAAGVPVVHVQHWGPPGSASAPDTPGWRIHPVLEPRPGETIVAKHGADAFADTDLEAQLEHLGARSIVVTGMLTERCVSATCRGAVERGYRVVLVADGHGTYDAPDHPAAEIHAQVNAELARQVRVLPAAELRLEPRSGDRQAPARRTL